MNIQHRAILLGLAIGDGMINVNRRHCPHPIGNCYLTIKHALRQKEYLEHKRDLLHNVIGGKPPLVKEINNSGYPGCRMAKGHKVFRLVRRALYKDKTKRITRRVLEWLDVQAIAIWYMDDGGLALMKRRGKIHARQLILNTHSFSFEEHLIIRDWFSERYGVIFTIVKSKGSYRLRCGTSMAKKFIAIVEPFIIPSMRYKIDLQYSGHEHPARVAKMAA